MSGLSIVRRKIKMLNSFGNITIEYDGLVIECIGVTCDCNAYVGTFKCEQLNIQHEYLEDLCKDIGTYLHKNYGDVWIDISQVLWYYKSKLNNSVSPKVKKGEFLWQ